MGGVYLNLPLPLFYDRDSGSALPTAALPYNDMRISFEFRDWTDLVIVDEYGHGEVGDALTDGGNITESDDHVSSRLAKATLQHFESGHHPKIESCELWANYAIVSQKERERMGKHTRDIVIEQVQQSPVEAFQAAAGATKHYDLRFSHAVKAVFFAVRNRTVANELSNYVSSNVAHAVNSAVVDKFPEGPQIIKSASLVYENTTRLGDMGVDYYTLVNPYYHAVSDGTDQPGVCMYSYSLELDSYDPMGSTNYGKLTNVTLSPTANVLVEKSDFLCSVVNYNVIRIAGGALGFPVL
jgi:hypothetical protein